MPIKKNIEGSNMYSWIQYMHNYIGGECKNKCCYCYVNNPKYGRAERYTGPIHLIEEELKVTYDFKKNYSDGAYIFIEHMNDLWNRDVPREAIERILAHCNTWPDNTYVFQTKNPERYMNFLGKFPPKTVLGITIETNRILPDISLAPNPHDRFEAFKSTINMIKERKDLNLVKTFMTLEPILCFDIDVLVSWIVEINPDFINLGLDSKGHMLPEPTIDDIEELVKVLHESGIELREKHNLSRLRRKT